MLMRTRRSSGLTAPLAALVALCLVAGCSSLAPRNALPDADAAMTEPIGFHNIRYWGDETALDSTASDPLPPGATPVSFTRNDLRRQVNLLAISGGAEDGAFGAGLLAGWGDAGNRPSFDLVTGVSSGALIAPFV